MKNKRERESNIEQKQVAIKMVRKIAAMNTLYRLNRAVTETASTANNYLRPINMTTKHTQHQCKPCHAMPCQDKPNTHISECYA